MDKFPLVSLQMFNVVSAKFTTAKAIIWIQNTRRTAPSIHHPRLKPSIATPQRWKKREVRCILLICNQEAPEANQL